MEELHQVMNGDGIKSYDRFFTFLNREYSILSTLRIIVCICTYLLLRRAVLAYIHRVCLGQPEEEAEPQQMEEEEEEEEEEEKEEEEEEEEVTVDKDKPIPLDYESEGEGWGSRARGRQRETIKRAEREAERRNLEEENGEIDKYLD